MTRFKLLSGNKYGYLKNYIRYEEEIANLSKAYNMSADDIEEKVNSVANNSTMTPLQACRKLWSEWK